MESQIRVSCPRGRAGGCMGYLQCSSQGGDRAEVGGGVALEGAGQGACH